MTFCLSIYLDVHVSCVYFLAIVINAAVNIGIQVSVRVLVLNFLACTYKSGIAVHRAMVCLDISGTTKLYSMMVAAFYIPTSSV